jgi:hypothetical protein
LNREGSWSRLATADYESTEQVSLDHVWHAVNFRKIEVEMEEVVVVKKKAKLATV